MSMEGLEELNQVYKASDAVVFLGQADNDLVHAHVGLQLCIARKGNLKIASGGKEYVGSAIAIRPGVAHSITNKESMLILWLSPGSTLGYFMNNFMMNEPIEEIKDEWIDYLQMFTADLLKREINEKTFVSAIINSMAEFTLRCLGQKKQIHKRLVATLQYLDRYTRYIVSLEEISKEMMLSEAEFLMFFQDNTGMTFDQLQEWKRVTSSFDLVRKSADSHALVLAAGFKDEKAYGDAANLLFGFSPMTYFY